MQYFRCKCGRHEWYTSMGVSLCEGCEECGTGPGQSPTTHREPVPHDFSMVTKVNTDEGEKTLSLCKHCYRSRRQIEQEEAQRKARKSLIKEE